MTSRNALSSVPDSAAHAARAPQRQRRKEARPQELLDAALDLFVERGFAATRSEDVAARAGVSKGTLYLYYPSKEELLKEVVRHNVVNQIAEAVDIVRQFEGGSDELLSMMLRLWWERIGETRASGIIKLMTSEARNFPEVAQFYVDEVIAPSKQLIATIIERGMARGEFRTGLNVAEVVHAIVAPLVLMAMNKHSLGACSTAFLLDPKAITEALIDLALHGLEAKQPARR
ncbi:MAG TPA: TetR/AcrR family transcriptional regulator [Burkholderiaceae bacterium]|nr:TetR/AcrR family transcriptional regulator [Burkholderiaceae bacterium]